MRIDALSARQQQQVLSKKPSCPSLWTNSAAGSLVTTVFYELDADVESRTAHIADATECFFCSLF